MGRQPRTFEYAIIDVDVHQRWRRSTELLDRLPARWRDYAVSRTGGIATAFVPAGLTYPFQRGVNKRLEAVPEDGMGTSFELMKSQYLDQYPSVEAVNLTFDIGQEVAQRNPEYSAVLSTAMNDWVSDTWLNYDSRMRTAIVAPPELPDRAAAEIHRMAPNTKVTGVLIAWNPFGKPLGHPVYDPIYRAAEEHGLPIIIHGAAGETEGGLAHTSAGGLPGSRLEWHTLLASRR
ncbi:amidohydrolase family protein [Microbacterium elymi]|uniref:Amidohydrolase family protein n=1 Tax=Microbacterium elymi TaxID=2909587 RepID=A0ABY5NHM7_9MICO|nr:amidohydrolase family protein [Microbacterium elymi]UUT34699.1 amidohydrolase family protein [Microbacterium elymi]